MNHGKKKNESPPPDEDTEELRKLLECRSDVKVLKTLVQVLPDDYYAWHVLARTGDVALLQINTQALSANPKSYPAWHHRFLIVSALSGNEDVLREEDRLTRLLLRYDPRNFHAWSYRRRLGLCPIRDLLNYSSLSDLIMRNQPIDAESLICTDPYYEGGYSALQHCEERALHIKVFASYAMVCFPRPFRGRVSLEDEVAEPRCPVLVQRFRWTESERPRVEIGEKRFLGREKIADRAFIDEMLAIDPDCALLWLAKLRVQAETTWVEKLCALDRIRERWYRRQKSARLRIFELVESGFSETQGTIRTE